MAEETVAAVKTSYGLTGASPNINRDWAEGVAATLGWIRAVHRRAPFRTLF